MMGQNQIGSELITSNSQQTSTDQPTLLIKCFKKKKFLWITTGIIVVILIVTIPVVIIKSKTADITKLSNATTETINMINVSTVTSETTMIRKQPTVITKTTIQKSTTTTYNPTTEDFDLMSNPLCSLLVQSKPESDKWKQHGITVAEKGGQGNSLSQLSVPQGMYIDDDESILIADTGNHRIVKWKDDPNNGQVIVGGMGMGDRQDQLSVPFDVTVDKQKNAIIICDHGNRRVMRLFRQSQTNPQILISNIACGGLAMDKNGSLYVSEMYKAEVIRWKEGDTYGIIVAGGNNDGNHSSQLNRPRHIFVDEDYAVYVADTQNHRIMKWKKDAKEGIVVAGGNGYGNHLNQLLCLMQ
ncbi:unnamed protein product [Adineta steineri]|uniref:Uncharacterized protein n=1 Tax=Adineta steineri TaxID=433720 RepID=A0A818I603_9BILA|nr:unnamed protein product [Adineta steineri]CAF3514142.1 unnamed protein product [Adineta steineri]